MPQILDVHLRRGLKDDTKAAHDFVMKPCSHSETRTLFLVHDLGGSHLTIVTDDMNYDPTKWGGAATFRSCPYRPNVHPGVERLFTVRLNRENRQQRRPWATDEELDALLTRLMDRAGVDVLSYDVRVDRGLKINPQAPTVPTATFTGVLRVVDASLFYQALLTGIGRTKRFGCGMILTRELPSLT